MGCLQMDRKQYFDELRRELNKGNVSNIEEIINDYEDLLQAKLDDGFIESEVLEQWESPQEVAKQYFEDGTTPNQPRENKQAAKTENIIYFIILQVLNVSFIPALLGILIAILSFLLIIPLTLLFSVVVIYIFGVKIDYFDRALFVDKLENVSTIGYIGIAILCIIFLVLTIKVTYKYIVFAYRLIHNYITYNVNLIAENKRQYLKIQKKRFEVLSFIGAIVVLYGIIIAVTLFIGIDERIMISFDDDSNQAVYNLTGKIENIEVNGNANVTITYGDENSITYNGDQAVLDYKIINNTLVVDVDDNWYWRFFDWELSAGDLVIVVKNDLDSVEISGLVVEVYDNSANEIIIDGVDVYIDSESDELESVDINSLSADVYVANAVDLNTIDIDGVDITLESNNAIIDDINVDGVDVDSLFVDSTIENYDVNAVDIETELDDSTIKNYNVDGISTSLEDN